MKKHLKAFVAILCAVSFFAGCANMADNLEEEQPSTSIKDTTPKIKDLSTDKLKSSESGRKNTTPKSSDSGQDSTENTNSTPKYSISYSTEYGTAPAKIENDNIITVTEKEILPLHYDKKTFTGWYDGKTGKMISISTKIKEESVFKADWRNIESGDIVLAEGPIVSPECYSYVKVAVHPVAIIYSVTSNNILGISLESTKCDWFEGSTKPNIACLLKHETGKDSYELVKKNNPSFSESQYPALNFAKHYGEKFSTINDCPYTDGWFLPSKKEIREAFMNIDSINKSYSKIFQNKKLLNYTRQASGGIWSCTSSSSYIVAIYMSEYEYSEQLRKSITSSTNKKNILNYTTESVNGNRNIVYYALTKLSVPFTVFCIREF